MKRIAYIQTCGSLGTMSIEINVKMDREITKNDENNAYNSINELKDKLFEETYLLKSNWKEQQDTTKANILALFENRSIYIEPCRNEYFGDDYYGKTHPWYIVTTSKGRIKIGWRKRVLNIDWKGSEISKTADDLFPNEDVTKWETGIHAWSYEKAKEYIDKLLNDENL